MKEKTLLFIILFQLGYSNLNAQILPTYYPVLESNKGLGNKKVSFHYYIVNTINYNTDKSTLYPQDSISYDEYIRSYSTLSNTGSNILNVHSGTLNSSAESSNNSLNFTETTQISSITSNQTENFALIQSGYFIPKQTGTYRFSIEGDDAVDLVINNKNIASHYDGHGASPIGTHSGAISLTAGVKYSFRARFQETSGGEVLKLFWKKPCELNSATWYQDVEELSSINVIEKGLAYKLDFNNFHSFPLNGTKVYDLVSSKVGTISNTSFDNSMNASFRFKKNNSSIDYGSSPTDFPATDISVSFWIHPLRFNDVWNIFFTKWHNGTLNTSDFHYAIKKEVSGSAFKQNLYTTDNQGEGLYSDTALSSFNWFNVGFTLKNGELLTFYLNGMKDGSVSDVSRTSGGDSKLYIGDPRDGGSSGISLDGYLNMVNIYNRALTPEEMLHNYNSEKRNFSQDALSFKNCKEILAKYPDADSGNYTIDINGATTGGEMDCYCDIETDGGGWTLVLNYLHQGGTYPSLDVKTTSLPLLGSTTLGTNEYGSTSLWGHASNSLMNSLNFTEVRFYGKTSAHSRVIHFKTSHAGTLSYFKGNNSSINPMNGVQTSYTLLTNHTAYLPNSARDFFENQNDYAMTFFPFWLGGTYHWGIGAGNRWEVDDYPNNYLNNTHHQIWIR